MSMPNTFVAGFHDEDAVRQMEYCTFGKTQMLVSKISLGCGTLSHFYGTVDETEAVSTIVNAIKRGINYIDTAPWYGQGESERILGKALRNIPRNAYYVATKIGRYELDIERQFDFSAAKTRASVAKSLALLGLDYVDVIQIHDIEFEPDPAAVIRETLPVLEELVAEGKARYIGVTGYPLAALRAAILAAPGRFDMVLTYSRNTLIDNSFDEYRQFFEDHQLGVVCASGHAMGMLTNGGPQSWHPAHQQTKDVCRVAAKLCETANIEFGKLAMDHFIRTAGPSTFLVGMQTNKLLDINLSAYHSGLTADETQLVERLKRTVFVQIEQKHWEGVELAVYRSKMQKLQSYVVT